MAWRWRAEADVGVHAGGDSYVGVAQKLLDHDEVDALFQEEGGRRVAEVAEADAAETDLVDECDEGAGEVGRVERSALRSGDHVSVVLPRGPCGLTLALMKNPRSSSVMGWKHGPVATV
ncbi:hypothetical protein GCM10022232_00930 [Streptomyces plumbiresistens]|uniref:Uncharacterized protein n=1 Tax=Streptomyces plumbiresistens TaxID=511811 RepID=A0ABP7PYP4_9ACTN